MPTTTTTSSGARASSRPATSTGGTRSTTAAAASSGSRPSATPARPAASSAAARSTPASSGPGARSTTTPSGTAGATGATASSARTPAAKPAAKPTSTSSSRSPAASSSTSRTPARTTATSTNRAGSSSATRSSARSPAGKPSGKPTAGSNRAGSSSPSRGGAAASSSASAGARSGRSSPNSSAAAATAASSASAAAANNTNNNDGKADNGDEDTKKEETEEEKQKRLEEEEELRKQKEEEERLAAMPKIDPAVQEARETLAARRKRVNELEIATQSLTHLLKAKTATERADTFQDKSTSLTVEVRKMKKEIDAVRHADRLLGSFKDELDRLHKHLRMRRAHIRQKRATIALMEQRSKEYAKLRREMVFELQSVNRDALQLAEAYEEEEKFSITVDPWAALKSIVEIDSEREAELGESIKKQAVFEHSHKATLRRVIQAKADLAAAVNDAADETAADLANALADWDEQRVLLEKQIAHKEKAFDEVSHHLHRGTNFLWTSQLQRADLRPLRELKLACDQHEAKLHAVEREVSDLGKAVADEDKNIERDVEEIDSKMSDTAEFERKLRERNEKLRQEYLDVQAQYPMLAAPPLLAVGGGGGSPGAVVATRQQSAAGSRSPTRGGPQHPSSTTSGGHRRSESEESFHGPRWMKPTSSLRHRDSKNAVQRHEQVERMKEFRSRRPGQALAKAQTEQPQL